MEYCLGDGDGSATIWDRGPDLDLNGDGILDAVGLDFDGDGLADDALADLDGDGIADHMVLDVDGPAERYFTDDGSGTWTVVADPSARPATALRWLGLDGVEHTGGPMADLDGDGKPDVRLLDTDGNGLADRAITVGDGPVTGYVDTDGDGRWDVKLTDTDGDGTADAATALRPTT
jgi:hypothetical protein